MFRIFFSFSRQNVCRRRIMGLRWELAFIDATEFTATKCHLPTKLYLKLTYFLSRCSFYVVCSKMFLLVSIPSFGHVDRKIEANKLATSDQQYQILPGKGIEYNNNTRRWILSSTKNEYNGVRCYAIKLKKWIKKNQTNFKLDKNSVNFRKILSRFYEFYNYS